MQRPNFLEYQGYRFLRLATLLAGGAALAYWAARPAGGAPYGGTWFGYLLGIAAALMVLLLTAYGLRRRFFPIMPDRRRSDRRQLFDTTPADAPGSRKTDRRKRPAEDFWRFGGNLQGWLSAHVYLGTALVVLATLHAGFRFGWNVHTLSYALVVLVVASGFYGVFTYLHYPRLITENLGENTMGGLMLKIAELDDLAEKRTLGLPDEVKALVTTARQGTRIGGSLIQQIGGRQRDCPTARAVQRIQELGKEFVHGDQPRLLRDLYSVLLQRQRLVARARRNVSLNARMQAWLYVHAPLSVALLAALFAHVVAILVYW